MRRSIINVPIGCGDAPVFPGDVINGDDDGCIVIPAHLAKEIADEAVEMTAFEDFVTEKGSRKAGRSSAFIRRPKRRPRTSSRPGAKPKVTLIVVHRGSGRTASH